jgi:hypothetical protein
VSSLGRVDGALLALLAGMHAAGGNAVEADGPAVAMAEQGCNRKKKTFFRDLDAKVPRPPPPLVLVISCGVLVLSCKIHNKS